MSRSIVFFLVLVVAIVTGFAFQFLPQGFGRTNGPVLKTKTTERETSLLYAIQIRNASSALASGNQRAASDALNSTNIGLRGWEYYYLMEELRISQDKGQRESTPELMTTPVWKGVGITTAVVDESQVFLLPQMSEMQRFDFATMEMAKSFSQGRQVGVKRLGASADGSRIVTFNTEERIEVWQSKNLQSEEVMCESYFSSYGPDAMAVTNDGQRIAIATKNRVELFAGNGGIPLQTFNYEAGVVRQLEFLHNAEELAIACGGTIRIISLSRLKPVREFTITEKRITDFCHHAGSGNFVAASTDGTVSVLDGTTGARLASFFMQNATEVTAVDINREGTRVIIGCADASLRVLDSQTGVELLSLFDFDSEITSVAFSHDGAFIATLTSKGSVGVFSAGSRRVFKREVTRLSTGRGSYASAVMDASGPHVIASESYLVPNETGGRRISGEVVVWNMRDELVNRIMPRSTVGKLVVGQEGKRLWGCHYNVLESWDLDSGKSQQTVLGFHGEIKDFALNRSGTQAAVASIGLRRRKPEFDEQPIVPRGSVAICDLATGKITRAVDAHERIVRGIGYTADGERIVSCGGDNNVQIWDAETLVTLHSIGVAGREIADVACHPLIDQIFVAEVGQIEILNSVTGASIGKIESPTGILSKLAISSDGRLLAVTNTMQVIELWDIGQRIKIDELKVTDARVNDLHFCEAGGQTSILASTGLNNAPGDVVLWRLTN